MIAYMKALLEEMNPAVNDTGGLLKSNDSEKYRHTYRSILKNADTECPPPDETQRKGKKEASEKVKSPESPGTIKRL